MTADVASRLIAAGMSSSEAGSKARLFASAESGIDSAGRDVRRWFVPGRIEVLGKHTDYAGGRSLLCAAERGMCVIAVPRDDTSVRIHDAARVADIEFTLFPDLDTEGGGWATYAKVVARRVARNFPGSLAGADIAIASDLPRSAGLSSSSVLVVAIFSALAAINRLQERDEYTSNIADPEELAGFLGCIENGENFRGLAGDRGVGTFGGSEDHTAILCCQAGQLSQYRFCPVKFERRIRLPEQYIFAIGSSGVVAKKIDSARESYNRISLAAATVLRVWNVASERQDPSLFLAASHAHDAPERIREAIRRSNMSDFSGDELRRRFDQFFLESQAIVPAAASALAAGSMRALGELVDRSQSAAERLLGNQVPETMELARSARSLGAYAASAFGAGFGGSVWALIRRDQVQAFLDAWRSQYQDRFPDAATRAEFFLTAPGPGITAL